MTIADICGNEREYLNGTTRNRQNTVSFHDGYGGETDRLSGLKRSGKPKQSMKAKEYVDKYYESLTSEDESISLSASKELFKDFIIDEPNALIKARNVKFDRGMIPIFKELNQKWFALCKQMEQKSGSPILKKDAFRDFWVERIPELSGKL